MQEIIQKNAPGILLIFLLTRIDSPYFKLCESLQDALKTPVNAAFFMLYLFWFIWGE